MARNTNKFIVIDGEKRLVNWRRIKKLYKRTCRQYSGVSETKRVLRANREHWPRIQTTQNIITINMSVNWL